MEFVFIFKSINRILTFCNLEIPEKARRPLVLISKVIQNLGNGVEFGSKENFMLPLNPFIQEYLPRIESFFDTLAVSFINSYWLNNIFY